MSDSQELQVQQKREVDKKTEGTTPGRVFMPVTDIFETPEALTVVLEMPGVDRDRKMAWSQSCCQRQNRLSRARSR
jgi:HSP20 family protein